MWQRCEGAYLDFPNAARVTCFAESIGLLRLIPRGVRLGYVRLEALLLCLVRLLLEVVGSLLDLLTLLFLVDGMLLQLLSEALDLRRVLGRRC